MFDPERWRAVPFHFWSVVCFAFGGIVGSFLNVCIHRMPRGQNIVWPGSHCPHCQTAIPWTLNVPVLSWLWLRGRCRFCGGSISPRYVMVELLTALLFLGAWLTYGRQSPPLALIYCAVMAGLIVATFVDFEHFIIPDEITLGGCAAGFLCSLLVPELHRVDSSLSGMRHCLAGLALGGGIIYLFLRLGKLLFGRQRFDLAPGTRVHFTETALVLPDAEIAYEEVFYRKSDQITLQARQVEMVDRGYWNVPVQLGQTTLQIGSDRFNTEDVPCLEVVTDQVLVPREAMGLGDVKFMAAIGAFLGWPGVLFSLLASAMLGSAVGVTLIALRRRAWSSRIPYGPYIALAATVWMFAGDRLTKWWLGW
jgi:leader peptidase (prepilin peptidase)/N-methyltransferase